MWYPGRNHESEQRQTTQLFTLSILFLILLFFRRIYLFKIVLPFIIRIFKVCGFYRKKQIFDIILL